MAVTEVVPTKFPQQEVKMMDRLIQRGLYISRSDLIREATREKIRENQALNTDFELMVKEMKDKGDFSGMEGKVLARIFLEKDLSEMNFSPAERKAIRKLIGHFCLR
jgi:Arc/MetJ-type ribon-helix-helix transcriptional regulator